MISLNLKVVLIENKLYLGVANKFLSLKQTFVQTLKKEEKTVKKWNIIYFLV